jgi:hypothetical protein
MPDGNYQLNPGTYSFNNSIPLATDRIPGPMAGASGGTLLDSAVTNLLNALPGFTLSDCNVVVESPNGIFFNTTTYDICITGTVSVGMPLSAINECIIRAYQACGYDEGRDTSMRTAINDTGFASYFVPSWPTDVTRIGGTEVTPPTAVPYNHSGLLSPPTPVMSSTNQDVSPVGIAPHSSDGGGTATNPVSNFVNGLSPLSNGFNGWALATDALIVVAVIVIGGYGVRYIRRLYIGQK